MLSKLTILIVFATVGLRFSSSASCVTPLGIEDGTIPDASFIASSEYSSRSVASYSRLNYVNSDTGRGGWAAATKNQNQWIQVDIGSVKFVTGIITQSRKLFDQWVTSYKVLHSIDGVGFVTVQENGEDVIFSGNTEMGTYVTRMFITPVRTKYVRINPLSWHENPSLRFELLGCQDSCGTPLGIEDGTIPDESFTASSQYSSNSAAYRGRLNYVNSDNGKGGWAAATNNQNQWIQVDIGSITIVTGVITQSKKLHSQWTTSYKVLHSIDGVGFITVQENGEDVIFSGNTEMETQVINIFNTQVHAKYIRINPITWHETTALRFELLGCAATCVTPLGIEDGTIPDDHFTASSEKHEDSLVIYSRLNHVTEKGYGGWRAAIDDQNQWIQVDIGSIKIVSGVITQSRVERVHWIKSYKVLHSINAVTFITIQKNGEDVIFSGNTQMATYATNIFNSPVHAKYIRINPVTWQETLALRFELLGCREGTILYNHRCYKFSDNELLTWSDAKAACERLSTQLITINTVEELNYFHEIATTFESSYQAPWTGLNDIEDEGNPAWLSNDQQTFTGYVPSDDNADEHDCFKITPSGNLHEGNCDTTRGYICEGSSILYREYSLHSTEKSPTAGYLIRNVLATSSGICSLECDREEQCVSFTFSSYSNECRLSTSTGQSSELEDANHLSFFVTSSTQESCRPLL